MTDDIVTRLRERAQERKEANEEYWRGYKFDYEIPELEDKAADEIERLQQLVEHLSSQLRLQMKANDKAWEAYKEVVGDD